MLENYPDLLTLSEVMDLLKISRLTLVRLDNELEPIRLGDRKDRRYLKQKLINFIESNHE